LTPLSHLNLRCSAGRLLPLADRVLLTTLVDRELVITGQELRARAASWPWGSLRGGWTSGASHCLLLRRPDPTAVLRADLGAGAPATAALWRGNELHATVQVPGTARVCAWLEPQDLVLCADMFGMIKAFSPRNGLVADLSERSHGAAIVGLSTQGTQVTVTFGAQRPTAVYDASTDVWTDTPVYASYSFYAGGAAWLIHDRSVVDLRGQPALDLGEPGTDVHVSQEELLVISKRHLRVLRHDFTEVLSSAHDGEVRTGALVGPHVITLSESAGRVKLELFQRAS
jgi:hypothetical protein